MPMFQDMNKKVYWMSFRDKTVFFNLALLLPLFFEALILLLKLDFINNVLIFFLYQNVCI